ncbi:DUF1996 domain-containing protein [Kineosporia succinea]|uniref:DUF1996 domain-containing protein n=1 Tax=Kineosporia succinea TaxID=84632 RepID=A0ABT9PEB6_9ACTN|nr:DUF1996 domain-containing protein [Kineosporia succinea]MDP9831056.1 hypothetical protein [Kineosporia succinea]
MSRRRPRLLRPAIALGTATVLGVTAAVMLGVGPGNSANLSRVPQHHGATFQPVAGSAGESEQEIGTDEAAAYAQKLGTRRKRHPTPSQTSAPTAVPSPSAAPGQTTSPGQTTTPGHTMTPGATMTMPTGDWIPVDQAAWKAQLDEFEALTPRTPPATAKKNPEFNATCTYSHSGTNDPIVFPGQAGKSHLHSFFGNESTDADTTTEDLLTFTSTTCLPTEDHSAYWMPSLTDRSTGAKVEPKELIVYYGSLLDDKTRTVPMPNGMRMVVGDAKKQEATPVGAANQFWCAGGPADGVARSTDGNWPVCEDNGSLHFLQRFPDCWDGKNLDSPDHKSHVSYGAAGTCPAAFPVRIPAVTFVVNYDTPGTAAGFELASGMASSMHFDGFFAWDTKTLADLVKSCVNQLVTCSKEKTF